MASLGLNSNAMNRIRNENNVKPTVMGVRNQNVLKKSTTLGNGLQAAGVRRTALSQATNLVNKAKVEDKKTSDYAKTSVTEMEFTKPALKKSTSALLKVKQEVKQVVKPLGKSTKVNEADAKAANSKIPKLNFAAKQVSSSSLQPAAIAAPKPKQVISFSQFMIPANVEDIDCNDGDNVLLMPEYVNDIYIYLRHLEEQQLVKKGFLSIQKQMTPKMRSRLVDWIIAVHLQFKLLPETLYLTIALMDRFFERESVSKDKIQLAGVTAFFIACKYEEIYPPEIDDFVTICDSYSKRDILKMEIAMLRTLNFELGRPLPLHFLRRNSKAAHADTRIHTMAKYLMELSLVEYESAHWKPSILAAASLYLTLKLIAGASKWNSTLGFYSNYKEDELLPVVSQLCKYLLKVEESKYQSCRKKYSSPKFMQISRSPELTGDYVKEIAAKFP